MNEYTYFTYWFIIAVAPVASTASVAEVPAVPHAQQFHTQDEFGNLAFGYSSPNSARYT